MIFWLMFTFIMLTGCTITIRPIEKPKRHIYTSIKKKSVPEKPKHRTHIVDSDWITNYKQLERDHGNYTIPGDHEIEAVNGSFRVPQSVINHFMDLSRAPEVPVTPTPVPSLNIAPP